MASPGLPAKPIPFEVSILASSRIGRRLATTPPQQRDVPLLVLRNGVVLPDTSKERLELHLRGYAPPGSVIDCRSRPEHVPLRVWNEGKALWAAHEKDGSFLRKYPRVAEALASLTTATVSPHRRKPPRPARVEIAWTATPSPRASGSAVGFPSPTNAPPVARRLALSPEGPRGTGDHGAATHVRNAVPSVPPRVIAKADIAQTPVVSALAANPSLRSPVVMAQPPELNVGPRGGRPSDLVDGTDAAVSPRRQSARLAAVAASVRSPTQNGGTPPSPATPTAPAITTTTTTPSPGMTPSPATHTSAARLAGRPGGRIEVQSVATASQFPRSASPPAHVESRGGSETGVLMMLGSSPVRASVAGDGRPDDGDADGGDDASEEDDVLDGAMLDDDVDDDGDEGDGAGGAGGELGSEADQWGINYLCDVALAQGPNDGAPRRATRRSRRVAAAAMVVAGGRVSTTKRTMAEEPLLRMEATAFMPWLLGDSHKRMGRIPRQQALKTVFWNLFDVETTKQRKKVLEDELKKWATEEGIFLEGGSQISVEDLVTGLQHIVLQYASEDALANVDLSREQLEEFIWWIRSGNGLKDSLKRDPLPTRLHMVAYCTSIYECIRRVRKTDLRNKVNKLVKLCARKFSPDGLRDAMGLTGPAWARDEVPTAQLLRHLKDNNVFVYECWSEPTGERDYAPDIIRYVFDLKYNKPPPRTLRVSEFVEHIVAKGKSDDKAARPRARKRRKEADYELSDDFAQSARKRPRTAASQR